MPKDDRGYVFKILSVNYFEPKISTQPNLLGEDKAFKNSEKLLPRQPV